MDSIANSFVQIKNAISVSKKEVFLPFAKIKLAILETLKKHDLIENYEEVKDETKKFPLIKVTLKYKNHESVLRNIRRVSRPGRRVYIPASQVARAMRGKIDIIISTSKGVMSGNEAKAKGLGGEILGEVE